MKEPIILYSVQTYLAYYINEEFYSNLHYVWCASCFDSRALAQFEPRLPITSNPRDLYNEMIRDISTRDNHLCRQAIERNVIGLTTGANARYKESMITKGQKDEILSLIKLIIENRNFEYFRPVIYVIPYLPIREKVFIVDYQHRALPLSPEYKIEKLHTKDFDLIDLGKVEPI